MYDAATSLQESTKSDKAYMFDSMSATVTALIMSLLVDFLLIYKFARQIELRVRFVITGNPACAEACMKALRGGGTEGQ